MLTLSRHNGTGGVMKQAPEDFVVKEIMGNGKMLEPEVVYAPKSLGIEEKQDGKHITFVLQKRDWNTVGALLAIAKKMGHGRKSIAYAGTKDKNAITVQLASIFHTQQFDLGSIRLKDIKINGFWRDDGVELSSNLGNAFEAVVRDASNPENAEAVVDELNSRMANYFGEQRFGDRGNNVNVGISILKGNFEEAAMEYLTGTQDERNEGARNARKNLRDTQDFRQALVDFPRYLKGERTVLAYLGKYPRNYANALKLLPRGIAMMFIHAVQSQIFNEELEQRIRGGDFGSKICAQSDFYGFPDMEKVGREGAFPIAPLVGYETKDEEIGGYAKSTMEKMQISKESFRTKGIPELAMKGAYRSLLAPVKELSLKVNGKDFKLEFSLPKGAYATVLLNEFTKNEESPG